MEGDGEQALQVDQRGFDPSELCLHLKKEKRPFYDPNFCLATLILNDFRHTPCHRGSNRVLSRAASESPRLPYVTNRAYRRITWEACQSFAHVGPTLRDPDSVDLGRSSGVKSPPPQVSPTQETSRPHPEQQLMRLHPELSPTWTLPDRPEAEVMQGPTPILFTAF